MGASQSSVSSLKRDGFDRRDWAALLGALLVSAALGAAKLLRRPELFRDATDVLFSDTGFNLLVAERLLAGGRLYAEVAFQYGPLPPIVHAAFASALGNSLSTYYLVLLLVSLVNVVLAYFVIRSCASRGAALAVVGLGLTATLLIPGSTLGAIAGTSYIPFERTVLLMTALLWTPPVVRSRRQAILLGCAIGAWQGVRFGGAGFLLAAVVAADLLALWSGRDRRRETFQQWGRTLFWTILAIVGVQVAWTAVAVTTLPPPIAADVLWPRHMLGSYRSWVTPDLRWPEWAGWGMLAGQLLTPLVGAVGGVMALSYYLRSGSPANTTPADRHGDPIAQIRLLIPFLFYAAAALAYFRMVFHFHQFAWALVIPAAWVLQRRGLRARVMVVTLLIPCFALNARISFLDSSDGRLSAFATPKGELLWASPAVRDELDALASALNAGGGSGRGGHAPSILVLPLGAGYLHMYRVDNGLRQPWLHEGMFRPYDEAQLLDSLESLDAVVVIDAAPLPEGAQLCASERTRSLSASTCARLAERLAPPKVAGKFLVYPMRK